MLIGGQRRGAILMMENSSSSLAGDDSSAEEYFDDDDTLGGGPSKIASRRRQQWPMGNGNGAGNFGGIRHQTPPLPSYARTASELFFFFWYIAAWILNELKIYLSLRQAPGSLCAKNCTKIQIV
jgi:hypothetical protein